MRYSIFHFTSVEWNNNLPQPAANTLANNTQYVVSHHLHKVVCWLMFSLVSTKEPQFFFCKAVPQAVSAQPME